jgi:hypothetical protein
LSSYFPFADDIRMEVLDHNCRFVVDCSSIMRVFVCSLSLS